MIWRFTYTSNKRTHTKTYNTQVYNLKGRYGYQRHELKKRKLGTDETKRRINEKFDINSTIGHRKSENDTNEKKNNTTNKMRKKYYLE